MESAAAKNTKGEFWNANFVVAGALMNVRLTLTAGAGNVSDMSVFRKISINDVNGRGSAVMVNGSTTNVGKKPNWCKGDGLDC
jgi:hypothetical protein